MYLPKDEMHINKFVDVALPTKAQIFARTGQRAVSPSGNYSGDDPVHFHPTKTESMENFATSVENLPSESSEGEEKSE